MRIGIISEGGADAAVIVNLLKGITGLDSSSFDQLQPQLSFDNTHLAHLQKEQKGGWSLVRNECQERTRIEQYFSLEGNTHIVVHLDADRAEDFDVKKPEKIDHQYCVELRQNMIKKIQEWMENTYQNQVLYAIAIEEIDAWVLVLFEPSNTCAVVNAKRKLSYTLSKKKTVATSNYQNYFKLSRPFSNAGKIRRSNWLEQNCSLKMFYDEAVEKLNQNEETL